MGTGRFSQRGRFTQRHADHAASRDLRQYAGAHGLDWGAFLGGGILGKIIGETIKSRLAKGERFYEPGWASFQ
jgi:hypothetical protein